MKINRNNYEQYFLDLVEGKLDACMQKELEQFLHENTDLKKELEEFENLSFAVDSQMKFNKKSLLRKKFTPVGKIHENNYENFLVAAVENDLTEYEKENLKNFMLKNTFVEKEQKLFSKAILVSDKSIIFENKTALKRTAVIYLNWQRVSVGLAIAASILLLLYFNFRNENFSTSIKNEIVETNKNERIKKVEPQNLKILENNTKEDKKDAHKFLAENKKKSGKEKIIRRKKTDILPLVKENDDKPLENNKEKVVENLQKEKNEIKDVIPPLSAEQQETINAVEVATGNRQLTTGNNAFTLKEFLAFKFKKNVLKENIKKEKNNAKITPVDLASAAVKGVSKIFGAKLNMRKQYNSKGELASVSISSPRFEITRTVH